MRIPIQRLFADPPITGRPLAGVAWHPDRQRFTYLEKVGDGEEAPADLWAYQLSSGVRERLVEGAKLGAEPPGGSEKPVSLEGYQWSSDGRWLLLASGGQAWRCEPGGGSLVRLLEGIDEQVPPRCSPDGSRLAYVRGGNLWVSSLAAGTESALTTDGSETVLNGKLDWVSWEELGGRRSWAAFEWSPDGARIALLRLDVTGLPEYPLVDAMELHPRLTRQRYPKAGDPVAAMEVRVVRVSNEDRPGTNVSQPDPSLVVVGSTLIPGYVAPELAWTPDGQAVAWTWLARDQRSLELRLLGVDGEERTLLHEADEHWLNRQGPPWFLPDGSFLWTSERTGRAHLDRHAAGGVLLHAVTTGEWQVEKVHGVARDHVYLSGTGVDPRERHLYRARLDGGGHERLTPAGAVHTIDWQRLPRVCRSPGDTLSTGHPGSAGHQGDEAPTANTASLLPWALVTTSDPQGPPVTRLVRGAGEVAATVRPPSPGWEAYDWAEGELVDVAGPEGVTLHARLLRPPDFDPGRRYPVVASVYGGPHAQVVQKTWAGNDALEQLLAQEGCLVWRLDNRGSWGRGHAFETPVDRCLGRTELADQLVGVAHLRSLPYVDGDRIGIYGWSYGGYLALYALTHAPEVWRCGVAGAPVTDWKLYDAIYTERYMGTPAENPAGYRAASPLEAADQLSAPLLLVHGTDDDNVHLQNTLQFVDALSRHRKPYDLLLQPRQKHGFTGEAARIYLHERIIAFFHAHLKGAK
jgi:dipeptidyl-peptidase-4